MSDIYVGSVGFQFLFTVQNSNGVVNISGAIPNVVIRPPNGSSFIQTGSLTTDGTNGQFQYTTQSGDISQVGWYKLQGNLTLGSNIYYTNSWDFIANRLISSE
jgi:hypothetical protein